MGCGSIENIPKKNNIPRIKQNIKPKIQELYTDKTFPPVNVSIFGIETLEKLRKGKKIPYNKYYKKLITDFEQKQITWKRAKDIFQDQGYTLFSENISLNSFIQGSIGNCYFLTVMTSLIKYPSLIYQLFNSLYISNNNYYEIKAKIDNKISTISLDDYFPYNLRKNKPIFCKPYKNEIWVMLLEKAWAKIKGSYFNMDNGAPIHVLNTFLLSLDTKHDISYKFHSLKNDKEKYNIWNIIIDKIKNKNIFMICLSKENLKDKKKLNNFCYSIVEKHFYNIIEIYENESGTKKLLKIRNPWGFNLKNDNYKNNNNRFIFDENDDNIREKENDINSLEDGEFIIDFNYFWYLFEEVQIYQIKKFNFNLIFNLKDEPNEIKIIYLKIKDIQLKEYLKLKVLLEEKIPSIEKKSINFKILIIEKENMKILKKIVYKINFNNQEIELPLILEPNISNNYYLCLELSSNLNKNNNMKINAIFQSENYIEMINYNHFFDDLRLFDIIKKDFEGSKFNINTLKFKENIFS